MLRSTGSVFDKYTDVTYHYSEQSFDKQALEKQTTIRCMFAVSLPDNCSGHCNVFEGRLYISRKRLSGRQP